jgi:hypothetical protein
MFRDLSASHRLRDHPSGVIRLLAGDATVNLDTCGLHAHQNVSR